MECWWQRCATGEAGKALLVCLALLFAASMAYAEDGCISSAGLIKKALELGEGSDQEIDLYKEAQRLCPKMPEAHFNLGLAYQKRGDLNTAEKELRNSIALKDETPFRLGLAGVLLQKGEVSAAREQYDLVVQKDSRAWRPCRESQSSWRSSRR